MNILPLQLRGQLRYFNIVPDDFVKWKKLSAAYLEQLHGTAFALYKALHKNIRKDK